MAEETIHKQEFAVRKLLTRSVVLYPARAQVIRDINDITLQPGANEITVYGLTPTADESSIKVDGKGSATITDMMVDLTPNRENYGDIFPEESDDYDSDDTSDGQGSSDNQSETIKALAREKKENEDSTKQASEERASASSRLAMLENYARSLAKDRPKDLEECITAYREERKKAYEVHFGSEARIKVLEKERLKIQKMQTKAMKATVKEKEKVAKETAKKVEKKRRIRQEKLDAKKRLKEERIQFWPRKVYRIILSLDTNSDMTPASSRRGSIDSLTKPMSEESLGSCQISLSVSYITHAAWWSPCYDLSLNTPTSSGLVIYRAEFCNTTSETWKDAKVILSTSQTSFQGLGEPLPSMQPWHIRLNKVFGKDDDGTSGALVSTYEMEHKRRGQIALSNKVSEPRNDLFGLGNSNVFNNVFRKGGSRHRLPQQDRVQQPQMQLAYQHQVQANSLFGSHASQQPRQPSAAFGSGGGVGLFGSSNTQSVPAVAVGSANPFFAQSRARDRSVPAGDDSSDDKEEAEYDGIADTIIPDLPSLATQESEWSETGMTTTYEIPGPRTIAPSHTMRRHKIASIVLKDVHLSYLLVPKLRTAAFLKARIRNTSGITLLKGPAGLTLDGSFLGNASLPRCSAGEPFSLSLGVDPSVTVTYSKPVVKRSQTGVFQKERNGVYTRTCTVTNTKSSRPLEGLVLDQIPVSEDERLKVDIIQPPNLRSEGDSAKSGTGIAAVGKVTENWGRARATLKKAGELCWDIKIEPGRGVKLSLEYEARFPSTEMVVGC